MSIETIPTAEVAKLLGTSHEGIRNGILNGTLPIGFVSKKEGSNRYRTTIIKKRFDAWINARDLEGKNENHRLQKNVPRRHSAEVGKR